MKIQLHTVGLLAGLCALPGQTKVLTEYMTPQVNLTGKVATCASSGMRAEIWGPLNVSDWSKAFLHGILQGGMGQNKTYALSGGMGYRRFIGLERVIGGYLLLDYSRRKDGFWYISPGVEAIDTHWHLSANAYIPVQEPARREVIYRKHEIATANRITEGGIGIEFIGAWTSFPRLTPMASFSYFHYKDHPPQWGAAVGIVCAINSRVSFIFKDSYYKAIGNIVGFEMRVNIGANPEYKGTTHYLNVPMQRRFAHLGAETITPVQSSRQPNTLSGTSISPEGSSVLEEGESSSGKEKAMNVELNSSPRSSSPQTAYRFPDEGDKADTTRRDAGEGCFADSSVLGEEESSSGKEKAMNVESNSSPRSSNPQTAYRFSDEGDDTTRRDDLGEGCFVDSPDVIGVSNDSEGDTDTSDPLG